MCAPNKRKRLPKSTAIPDRKVLINKCGNYASGSISELLKKHGPYPIFIPENEVLLLSSVSDRPIQTKSYLKKVLGKEKSKVKTSKEISERCQRRTKHISKKVLFSAVIRNTDIAKYWLMIKMPKTYLGPITWNL